MVYVIKSHVIFFFFSNKLSLKKLKPKPNPPISNIIDKESKIFDISKRNHLDIWKRGVSYLRV